jgi:16S rRNA (guanine527-N7)-methyltransferase
VLREARLLGFLGPGPPETHIEHAGGFVRAVLAVVPDAPRACVDLGSGGGVPGLVLAAAWPGSTWALVEARQRRRDFLVEAVARLGLVGRARVVGERAEVVGRDPTHRGGYALVVARSFGPPAVTAECAAPLLAPGGLLVVSEPPGSDGARWDAVALAPLGLSPARLWQDPAATFEVLLQQAPCPDRFPRRAPSKRPLF